MVEVMAKRTLTTRCRFGKGPDEIDLFYFGPEHKCDAWLFSRRFESCTAGDIFSGKTFRSGAANGGSGVAIGDSLMKAFDTVKNVDTIITVTARS